MRHTIIVTSDPPIAKQKINLDGQIDEKEWNDAFKINFTSPSIDEGGVVVFLGPSLTESLSGAFIIPDKTPVGVIKNPDQIVFLLILLILHIIQLLPISTDCLHKKWYIRVL